MKIGSGVQPPPAKAVFSGADREYFAYRMGNEAELMQVPTSSATTKRSAAVRAPSRDNWKSREVLYSTKTLRLPTIIGSRGRPLTTSSFFKRNSRPPAIIGTRRRLKAK